jgi:nucleotide-binding universal stress UspA family protein
VIAGVRSSAGARHTLVTAAREARLRAGALIAVHAQPLGNVDAQLLPAAAQRLREQGDEWLAAQLVTARVHSIPEVVVGGPAEALLRYSAHAALLVLGAHESSTPWGGAPGATITHCIRHARCPVMVVPDIPGSQPRLE